MMDRVILLCLALWALAALAAASMAVAGAWLHPWLALGVFAPTGACLVAFVRSGRRA